MLLLLLAFNSYFLFFEFLNSVSSRLWILKVMSWVAALCGRISALAFISPRSRFRFCCVSICCWIRNCLAAQICCCCNKSWCCCNARSFRSCSLKAATSSRLPPSAVAPSILLLPGYKPVIGVGVPVPPRVQVRMTAIFFRSLARTRHTYPDDCLIHSLDNRTDGAPSHLLSAVAARRYHSSCPKPSRGWMAVAGSVSRAKRSDDDDRRTWYCHNNRHRSQDVAANTLLAVM